MLNQKMKNIMWLTLNTFSISESFKQISRQVATFTNPLSKFVFPHVEPAATKVLHHSYSYSLQQVIVQTKKEGSALLETSSGHTLIEIVQQGNGSFIFIAVDQDLKPIVYSGPLFDVQVSHYLTKILSDTKGVSYGVVAKRWDKDLFSQLKEYLIAHRLLREKGNKVTLKLPQQKLITFQGPFATNKADVVIKHHYHKQNCPIEGENSVLKGLIFGYLFVTGLALGSSARGHNEDRAALIGIDGFLNHDDLGAIAKSSGFCEQIKTLSLQQAEQGNTTLYSELQSIQFKENCYCESYSYEGTSYFDVHDASNDREIHHRKVYPKFGLCEEYQTEMKHEKLIYTHKKLRNKEKEVQKVIFEKKNEEWTLKTRLRYLEKPVLRVLDPALTSYIIEKSQDLTFRASFVFAASLLAKQTATMTLISAFFALISKAQATVEIPSSPLSTGSVRHLARSLYDPITILKSIPNFLVQPNNPQSYMISLLDYQLANPYQNKELYIASADGTPLPNWVNLGMGPITTDSSIYLKDETNSVLINGRYAYLLMEPSSNNCYFNIFDLSQNTPKLVGNLPLNIINLPSTFFVYNNLLTVLIGNTLTFFNTSSLSNITFDNQITFSGLVIFYGAQINNLLYFLDYQDPSIMAIVDINNATNYQQISSPNCQGVLFAEGDLYCATLNGTNWQIAIMDATDPLNPKLASEVATEDPPSCFAKSEKYLYTSNTDQTMSVSDISDKTNIVVNNSVFLDFTAYQMKVVGKFLYAFGLGAFTGKGQDNEINVIDITTDPLNPISVASFQIFANPTSGYNNNIFAIQNNKIYIPNGVLFTILDASQRELTFTPQAGDWGLHFFNITTTDDSGNAVVQQIGVNVGDIQVNQIATQQINGGSSGTFTLDPDLFQFPNAHFTYTATQVGGIALPSGLKLNGRTFSYDQVTPGTYDIEVTADNGWGGVASAGFSLIVAGSPVVENILDSQTATVGTKFLFVVPQNTFSGLNIVTYALQSNGKSLPSWLSYQNKTMTFTGTPSSTDQSIGSDAEISIDLWAANGVGKTKTSFVIILTGTSFYAKLAAALGYTFTAVTTLSTAYYERARVSNYLFKDKYQKEKEYAYVNEPYSRLLLTPEGRKELAEVKATQKGKHLVKSLPDGLEYKQGCISGIPSGEDTGRFLVRAIAHHGFIREEYQLIIKQNKEDPDPELEIPWYSQAVSSAKSFVQQRKRKSADKGSEMAAL